MEHTGEPTRVVAITRANLGGVQRWRGVRSGIRTYLQALVDGEWCQVVETRSDPECLPPRRQRLRAGEYTWAPPRQRGGENVKRKTDN
ncbi:MAG: hypothetical protein H6Q86_5787 [candidate division NC10 bacterium]|jgi:hypothetical protein|nr:hypothetical protein [candidate division NC10 bacterium]